MKNIAWNFLISISFYLTLSIKAECQFIKFQDLYPIGGHCSAIAICQTADSGFVSAGRYGNGPYQFFLLKVDKAGQTQWLKKYTNIYEMNAEDLQITSDGGFAISGAVYHSNSSANYFLFKTDSAGNMEWSREFLLPPDTVLVDHGGSAYQIGNPGNKVCQTDDNGFILAGLVSCMTSNELFFQLIKTDPAGNVEWTQCYNANYKSQFFDLELVYSQDEHDSLIGYVICAEMVDSVNFMDDIVVSRIDYNGQLLWSRVYIDSLNFSSVYEQGHSITQTGDNGFVITGSAGSPVTGAVEQIVVIKTDSSGIVQWSSVFTATSGFPVFYDNTTQLTTDNGYVISAEAVDSAGVSRLAILFKISTGGNLQWAKSFRAGQENYAKHVIQTSDNGFAFCGGSFDSALTATVYLVKTDAYGNTGCNDSDFTVKQSPGSIISFPTGYMIPVSITDSLVAPSVLSDTLTPERLCLFSIVEEVSLEKNSISVFPNPSHEVYYFNLHNSNDPLSEIRIRNIFGETILVLKSNAILELTDQSNGVYFYEAVSRKGFVFNGKLLKE